MTYRTARQPGRDMGPEPHPPRHRLAKRFREGGIRLRQLDFKLGDPGAQVFRTFNLNRLLAAHKQPLK